MTLVAMFVNAMLMIALPVVVVLAVRRATGVRWALLFGGAVAFILSQVVHFPLLWTWTGLTQAGVLPAFGPLIDAMVLGALAGLCEEPARAILFWRVFPGERGRDAALFAGAGHGGVEALIFGVLVLLGAVNVAAMSEMTVEQLVALGTPADAAALAVEQVHAALAAPWYEALAGAFERAITIPFHMACSMLVVASLRRKSIVPFAVAVLAHAALDTVAVLVAGAGLGTWRTELALAACAVPVSIAIWVWAFRAEPRVAGAEASPPAA